MNDILNEFISETNDEWPDTIYGAGYRCSVDLIDGTHLPCVMLRRPKEMVSLAIRRIEEEMKGEGVFSNKKGAYRKIVELFVTDGNRINAYDIKSISPSQFALPTSLLSQIHGETVMSWTGWVFEMKDGKLFSYGTTFLFEFFHLPKGYEFSDVSAVHNHSYLDTQGSIKLIRGDNDGMINYKHSDRSAPLYRERPYFTCYVNEK